MLLMAASGFMALDTASVAKLYNLTLARELSLDPVRALPFNPARVSPFEPTARFHLFGFSASAGTLPLSGPTSPKGVLPSGLPEEAE